MLFVKKIELRNLLSKRTIKMKVAASLIDIMIKITYITSSNPHISGIITAKQAPDTTKLISRTKKVLKLIRKTLA